MEDAIIKEKNRKIAQIIIVIAVVLALIMSVMIYASGNSKKELQKQLDLGAKYLAEMDYENAIIAYEAAIEIEPKSAEAYLGLADVYVGQGEYESALEVLQRGYVETASGEIGQRIEELRAQNATKETMGVDGSANAQSEEGDEIEEKIVDGVLHHGYKKYVWTESTQKYLDEILGAVKNNDKEKLFEFIESDRFIDIFMENNELVNTEGSNAGELHILIDEYKLYFSRNIMGEQEDRDICCLPIGNGRGIVVTYENYGKGQWMWREYGVGDVSDGMFNGAARVERNYERGGISEKAYKSVREI